jgi:hypothetical protein
MPDPIVSEEDGARLLGSLRTVDVPASGGVSVERAIRTGRRTKALRVAAAGVFVLIAAGVLPFLIRPSGPPPVAAGAFDPLVRTIGVGPATGFHPVTYVTGRESQMIELYPDDRERTSVSALVVVNAPRTLGTPSGEPMADVNGKRALWTGTNVAIEWEHDAWAFVQVQGTPDDRGQARLLADGLRFDEHVRIVVPFTVETSLPFDGARIVDGYVELEFAGGLRIGKNGSANGPGLHWVPQEEREELERSRRPADPPVTNPLR